MTLHLHTTREPHGPATALELTDAQVDELGVESAPLSSSASPGAPPACDSPSWAGAI